MRGAKSTLYLLQIYTLPGRAATASLHLPVYCVSPVTVTPCCNRHDTIFWKKRNSAPCFSLGKRHCTSIQRLPCKVCSVARKKKMNPDLQKEFPLFSKTFVSFNINPPKFVKLKSYERTGHAPTHLHTWDTQATRLLLQLVCAPEIDYDFHGIFSPLHSVNDLFQYVGSNLGVL